MNVVKSVKEALTIAFGDESAKLFSNPENVKQIILEDFVFQEEPQDFDFLSVFKELRYLNISGTMVRNIEPTKSLRNLEILYADFCMITDISPLSNLYNLKELDLSAPLDFIDSLEPLKDLKKLEKLYVPDHPITTIKPLFNSPNLKILSLARTQVPAKEIEEFKKLHSHSEVWI